MGVGHGQCLIIFHVYFFLPRAPFAFGIFNANASARQAIAQGAHVNFFLRGLLNPIILDEIGRGLHVTIAFGVAGFIAIIEQEEF